MGPSCASTIVRPLGMGGLGLLGYRRRRKTRGRDMQMPFRPRVEGLEDRCLPSTVTNLSDHDPGSLRDAIASTPSGGTVDFQAGLSGTIILTTSELGIAKDLTITGPGADVITVSGNHAFRIFNIAPTFVVAISGLTIADGNVHNANGGGILNGGTLSVTDCTLRDNSVSGDGGFTGRGGGISGGTVTVTGSIISGNSVSGLGALGGGISGDTVTVTGSAVSGNSASGHGTDGGGILGDTVTVTDSTVSDNSAVGLLGGAGGGISGGMVRVIGSTVSSNRTSGGSFTSGGGISGGTVTVTSSTVSGNSVSGRGSGGGIFGGTVTVTESTVSDNSASGLGASGGGISGDMVIITRSTVSDNSANNAGGIGGGTVTVSESTISGNSASPVGLVGGSGGGVSGDRVTVTGSTISGNSASGRFGSGGGIAISGACVARNTIIARNIGPGSPDVFGTLTSQGHNLIGDSTGGSGFADTDMVGTSADPIDPQLEPLGDYGGPTPTMRPLPTSPAVDAGDNTDAPKTDQRGFDRIVNGIIDIGSVELQPDEFGPRSRESLLIVSGKLVSGSWGPVVEAPVSPVARQEVTEPLQHVDTTVRRAKDLVFGESRRAQRPVPASEWESNELVVPNT